MIIENELIIEYAETLAVLDELAEPLHEEYRPYIKCCKGCFECCLDGFRVRYIEGLYLLHGFSNAEPEVIETIGRKTLNPSDDEKIRCPALIDGACSLYKFRPALCRAYGLLIKLDDQTSKCKLNFNSMPEGVALKSFDIGLFYDLIDSLSRKLWTFGGVSVYTPAPYLTIRQFFEYFIFPELTAGEETTVEK